MENISIQTSQNVAIEQPIASIGERLAAAFFDILFFAAYAFVISIIGGFTRSALVIAVLFVPVIFYHLFCEVLMNGQSWGKKILKIKVVHANGSQAGFLAYFLRWLFRLIDVTILFGSIATVFIIFSKKGQRIGDLAANTIVIRTKASSSSKTPYVNLPENYQLCYPEVSRLSLKDIYTVKEVLDFLQKSRNNPSALQMADKARAALEAKMQIKANVRSENFLFKVLRDYNYLQIK